jgi:hypothetical protein
VLLNCGLGGRRFQRLQVRGDVKRLDIGELADTMLFDPGEEVATAR